MRILTVVGNRPQFVKAAAVSSPLRRSHEEVLVHTGQHHDQNLSEVFFEELSLARPERQLHVAGGSSTSQVSRMLSALEPLLIEVQPDAMLVYGDTNSTLAGALAAAQADIPVIHVEAGMRSFDKRMPEERNRVITDHLSSLLLCPSESAVGNLSAESIASEVVLVGDVMVDVAMRSQSDQQGIEEALAAHSLRPGSYLLLSAHRAGNVDLEDRLERLVDLIAALPSQVLFPLHPRTRARLVQSGLYQRLLRLEHLTLLQPLPYREFTALLNRAKAVLTDSGGVQKEAYLAGVPCLTLRDTTEWVETVQAGWNTLVDLDTAAALRALATPPQSARPQLYGDGKAAERCVEAITAWGGRGS